MARTYHKAKGKKVRPTRHDQKPKQKKTKFMGHTSGQHSRGIEEVEWEIQLDGNYKVTVTKSDRAPVKGKDFTKYGYPDHGYPRHLYKAKKKGYDIE